MKSSEDNTLQQAATRCNTLQHADTLVELVKSSNWFSAWYSDAVLPLVSQYLKTRCNTLQHAATSCNTLQYAAIRCNTLQHATTHSRQVHVLPLE